MLQSEHDRIIQRATELAATHKIIVQDVSGSRRYKAVYAVPLSQWGPEMNFWNRKPIGESIWEGKGTATEMRHLCRDLKSRKLMDENANETFQSSRNNTGYYDPS